MFFCSTVFANSYHIFCFSVAGLFWVLPVINSVKQHGNFILSNRVQVKAGL